MKKDVIDLIYKISLPFFEKIDFKLKKNNQGGIIYNFKTTEFTLFGGIGFFDAYKGITYIGESNFNIQIIAIEKIYDQALLKSKFEIRTSSRTFSISDIEFRNQVTENGNKWPKIIPFENKSLIEEHTIKILDRIEKIMLPQVEESLSLPYWISMFENKKKSLYEREIGGFYPRINDDFMIKHLIILKLCDSPSYEKAFEIHLERTKSFLEKFPDSEHTNSQNILVNNLKEILDATPAKYDYKDLTPPFKFVKNSSIEEPKSDAKRVITLAGKEVEVEINSFEVSEDQQTTIDEFLNNIALHFENAKLETINNAEFENEQGQLQDFEDCSFVLYSIAEATGLLAKKPKDFEVEAAKYLYIKHISIDPDNNNAVLTMANTITDQLLYAHVTLSGHIDIVTGN
jgi:hypothetical protein